MKQVIPMMFLTALMLAVLPFAAGATTCAFPGIGIYADEGASHCDKDVPVYVSTNLYVMLEHAIPDPIIGAQFAIENWGVVVGGAAITTEDWNTPIIVGNASTGISLFFPDPIIGDSPALLGVLTIFSLEPDFPGMDLQLRVVNAQVEDINEQVHETLGGLMMLNPTNPPNDCFLTGTSSHWLKAQQFDPPTFSPVAGEFNFRFTIESWVCCVDFGPIDYAGRIFVQGDQVHEFSGSGVEEHEFLLSADGIPDGGTMEVVIQATNDEGASTDCLLVYNVDTSTGIPETAVGETSFSKLRKLYD